MKSRNKQNWKNTVPTDEPYVDNENLITGAKFNYDRTPVTERQISELCISEKLSLRQKFIHILERGEKIQKWSIFENFKLYSLTPADTEFILDKIIRDYPHYVHLLPIMGDGIRDFLVNLNRTLTKKQFDSLFYLTFHVLTHASNQVDEWAPIFMILAGYPEIPKEECLDYINGSFNMNSAPERRRVALEMIQALMKYSSQVEESARSKVIFFNQDQNSKTRETVCRIMHKLLLKDPQNEEIWKAIWEYYHDKDEAVRRSALETISTIKWRKNFKTILHLFTEQIDSLLINFIDKILLTHKQFFEEDAKAKMEIVAFCNRIFKSKNIPDTVLLLQKLRHEVLKVIGMMRVQEQVNFSLLDLKEREILQQLLQFYHQIDAIEFKDTLKFFIFRGLKQLKYEISNNCEQLSQILDLHHQEEINLFITICTALLDASKWHQLEKMLLNIFKITPYQTTYDRLCLLSIRMLMSAPNFLVGPVIDCIIHLLIINKKSLELLITIREKILNSKFWSYRKDYILIYRAIKAKTSFEYQKTIPILMYKGVLNEKSFGVKLTFLESAPDIYKYTEPSIIAQKNTIKETVSKLQEDKDPEIRLMAQKALAELKKIDVDSAWLSQLYNRNREMLEREEAMKQITPDPKKTIKTECEIRKSVVRKRVSNDSTRRTINLGRGDFHKDVSTDSINQHNSKVLNLQSKKPNLFRCHSVKMKIPNKKK